MDPSIPIHSETLCQNIEPTSDEAGVLELFVSPSENVLFAVQVDEQHLTLTGSHYQNTVPSVTAAVRMLYRKVWVTRVKQLVHSIIVDL